MLRLDWLRLGDFRSYRELRFEPEPGVNVLVGANGAGKTNVLEAIGYLSKVKSFRRSPDEALIRHGEDQAVVRGEFIRESGELKVEMTLPRSGRRTVLSNGKRPKRHADLAASLPMVTFLPDDLDLVKRGPALRREFLDDLAASLNPSVAADLDDYTKTLRQRNSLLRTEGRQADRLALAAWDAQLAAGGARVLRHRLELIGRTAPLLEDAYRTVGGDGTEVSWHYESSWAGEVWPASGSQAAVGETTSDTSTAPEERHRDLLATKLEERRGRDFDQRTTTAGPHRDDPVLLLGVRPVRTEASQGEQRSAALALRLVAYRLLEERHRIPPLLLLDDVFSELDPSRASGVASLLPRGQVFVTTAREDEVPVEGRRWRVVEGSIS